MRVTRVLFSWVFAAIATSCGPSAPKDASQPPAESGKQKLTRPMCESMMLHVSALMKTTIETGIVRECHTTKSRDAVHRAMADAVAGMDAKMVAGCDGIVGTDYTSAAHQCMVNAPSMSALDGCEPDSKGSDLFKKLGIQLDESVTKACIEVDKAQ